MLNPTTGKLLFEGRDVTHTAPQRLARMGVGRTFQDVRLFDTMTAWDNVAVFAQTESSGTLRSGFLWPGAVRREAKRVRARVDEVLEYSGLASVAGTVAGELSFAQQKKVAIARCLAQRSRLMLLDEPASGLDGVEREDVAAMIAKLADDGVTILLVEHNMDIVREVAHRAVFLAEGKIVGGVTPDRLLQSSELAEIYFGHVRTKTELT